MLLILAAVGGIALVRRYNHAPAQPIQQEGLASSTRVTSTPPGLQNLTSTSPSGNPDVASPSLPEGSATIHGQRSTDSGATNEGLDTFTSKTLGLSFQFWQDATVLINESGTILTIRARGESSSAYPDHLIEVFDKDPQESFQQSVEDVLSSEKAHCVLEMLSSSTNYMPPAFNQQIEAFSGTIPPDTCYFGWLVYDDQSGAYFAYNSQYPDSFYFYDFGQAVWPDLGGGDNSVGDWRTTIQLINFDTRN